jgi:hypothetical protein
VNVSATPPRTTGEEVSVTTREELVLSGIRLSYATIGYNSLEAIASLIAGLVAGSVALIGLGDCRCDSDLRAVIRGPGAHLDLPARHEHLRRHPSSSRS